MLNRHPLYTQLKTVLLLLCAVAGLQAIAVDVNLASDAYTYNEEALVKQVTVTLSAPEAVQVTVDYTTSDDTAEAGSDYTAAAGTLSFNPGETAKVVDLTIAEDGLDEFDETFFFTISNATNATLGATTQATVTIEDNDNPPFVTIESPATVTEGTGGNTVVNFTVDISAISDKDIYVELLLRDGTATVADGDFTAPATTLYFEPGESQQIYPVTVVGDARDEIDETFAVQIGTIQNALVDEPLVEAVTTIEDDDDPPVVSSSGTASLVEGDSGTQTTVFTIALDAVSGKTVEVDYATSGTTATAGEDFTAVSGTLTYQPGETTKTVAVVLLTDVLDEFDETYTMQLSNPVEATLGSSASQTILDDDVPLFSVSDGTATEGSDIEFTVTMSLQSVKNLTVRFETDGANNSAHDVLDAVPGVDFTVFSGALTFVPYQVSQTVAVSALQDSLDEDDEPFNVYLSNIDLDGDPDIDDGEGEGIIVDDDVEPTVSITESVVLNEEDVAAELVVTLSEASGRSLEIDYATNDVTANAGSDFTAIAGTLTFAPGNTAQTLTVPINDDSDYEQPETFEVLLLNPLHVTVAGSTSTIRIIDNEPTHTLVYRLVVRGQALEDDEWDRVSSYRRAFLLVDPTRGQATALVWLRHNRQLFPLIQHWHEDAVTIGFPLLTEDGNVAIGSFAADEDINGVTTAYRARFLTGMPPVERPLSNGDTVPSPPFFSGHLRASATNLWPLATSDASGEFDLLDLSLRARLHRGWTYQANQEGERFEEIVEQFIDELDMEHTIDLANVQVTATPADPCVLVYRVRTVQKLRRNGGVLRSSQRGYLVVDLANEEMNLVMVGTPIQQTFTVTRLHYNESPIFQQLPGWANRPVQILGSINVNDGPNSRPDTITHRYWTGQVFEDRRVGPNKFVDVAPMLRGKSISLELQSEGNETDDVVINSHEVLKLQRIMTWDANQNGDSVEDVTDQIVHALEEKGFSDTDED